MSIQSVFLPLTAVSIFFLPSLVLAQDADNDGLSDADEVNTYATDPANWDTDGDGIGDGGEVNAGLDALNAADGPNLALQISDGILYADRPWAAVDASGNIHVVWSEQNDEIWYKMLDSGLNTLIDQTAIAAETGLTFTGQRPQIAIGSDSKAYVLWTDDCYFYFQRLDPSLDDRNGDAADPAVLVEISVDVSDSNCVTHSKFVMDASDDLHIVSEFYATDLEYRKIDSDGNELVAYTWFGTLQQDHGTVGMGLDSNGDVHVSWTDDSYTSEDELYYAMLSGADGSIMIAETLLSEDDGDEDKHTSLIVDNDLVTIVWGGCCTDSASEEVYLMQLDPSLDDQNGDDADPVAITTVSPTRLSADDGQQSWYITATQAADGTLDITWQDAGGSSAGPVAYLRADLVGNVLEPETLLTSSGNNYSYNPYAPVVQNAAYINEDVDGVDTIVRRQLRASNTVMTATATGIATVTMDAGRLLIIEALALADLPAAAQSSVPTDVDFVDGYFRIVIDGVPTGGTVNVTLDLPGNFTAGTDIYYKWDAVNDWQEMPYTNGTSTNQVILALTDGGAGDADGVANGQIVDPGGPGAVITIEPPPTGSGGFLSGGGCTLGTVGAPGDSTLPILMLIALLYVTRRRWMRIRLF